MRAVLSIAASHPYAVSTPLTVVLLLASSTMGDGLAARQEPTAQEPTYQAESTAKMVERLEFIKRQIQENPGISDFENDVRVAFLQAMTPPSEPGARGNYLGELAQELMRAGRNEEAIATLTELFEFFANSPEEFPEGYHFAVWEALAIAHFRVGVTTNCIENETPAGCIVPIRPEAVHAETRDMQIAIELFERVLEASPDDLETVWLLNIAYQMIGGYPDDVPERWLIPTTAFEADYDIKLFQDVAPALGLNTLSHAGGGIMDDFDNDGLLDIVNSARAFSDRIRFFRNNGDGTFEDRTSQAGLDGLIRGLHMIHADYDNDGFNDIFVLRGGWMTLGYPNSLLRNNGDGTFEDVTEAAGLLTPTPSQTAGFRDYDNDGDLDLFIGNETSEVAGENPCELYRNNGDGTFTNVAEAAGVDVAEFIKALIWGDYDNDGREDLFISVHGGDNHLFHNDGPDAEGQWRFTDVAADAGVLEPFDSFPTWFWDYDNDGWQDLFVSGRRGSSADMAAELLGRPIQGEVPRLYRNNGDGTFTDVAAEVGLDKLMYTMGTNFGDLDNDGWLDFYVGTGDPRFQAFMPNRVFRNAGARPSRRSQRPEGSASCTRVTPSRSATSITTAIRISTSAWAARLRAMCSTTHSS